MDSTIHSKRLDLIPLCPEFLRAVVNLDLAEAGRILGMPVPVDLLDCMEVISLRLGQLEADATYQPWSLRAMVLRERREMIGHVGFHTAPGAEYLSSYSPGGVEIGFTVHTPFRRHGYAAEASRELMRWAHQDQGVTRFVLSISPDNTASQSLAARLGFVRFGSHVDKVDGTEEILEHRLFDDNAGQAESSSPRMKRR